MIYEYNCARCGKPVRKEFSRRYTPKYCGPECCREAQKERQRALQEARKPLRALPLVPYNVCKKCRWGRIHNKDNMSCTYMEHHDHTRTSLHPEGLTAECKEFEPRRKPRNGNK